MRTKINELFKPLSLVTNLCKGYTLLEALDISKEAGFTFVELASILGMCEHFTPSQLDDEFIENTILELKDRGLSCHAVSGHVDLTIDDQCDDFIKKIEFASRIGAKIINTNSGPQNRLDEFYKNMRRVIAAAERYEVIIGLESHGDIINTAKESIKVFKYFNHPLVRFNYDTGNTFFYNNGSIKIEEDILYSLEYLSYIHLKDIRIRGNQVNYCALGEGDINLKAVINSISSNLPTIPCGMEIPVHVKGVLGNIVPVDTPMSREDIFGCINKSLKYIATLLK